MDSSCPHSVASTFTDELADPALDVPPPVPREIGGYTLLGRIARGGMADVHAVRAPDGTLRAMKVLHTRQPAVVERMRREAIVQAMISHPNVLPLVDTVSHAGARALVLPYVAGPTLAELLANVRLTLEEADGLFAQVVAGVAALHRLGVVHRDIKPANVLLEPTADGVVARLADLGLAKIDDLDLPTARGTVLGTPAYAAPEQLVDAADVDPRADVWALGALWAELRNGRRPARDGLASGGPALLDRMLAPDPLDRPADALEVQLRLGRRREPCASLTERCRALAPAF